MPFNWLEALVSDRATCAFGMSHFDAEYDHAAALRRNRGNQHELHHPTHFKIRLTSVHFVADNATHTLVSTAKVKLIFKNEEEDVVIRNGRTPKEKERR